MIDASSTYRNPKSAIAGIRNACSRTNARLPVNIVCNPSSSSAGTHVTNARSAITTASLPAMYSTRVSGFDR